MHWLRARLDSSFAFLMQLVDFDWRRGHLSFLQAKQLILLGIGVGLQRGYKDEASNNNTDFKSI